MYFVFRGLDKPGHLQMRLDNREAHLAFIRANAEKIRLAGPLLDDSGEMRGSLVIVEAEDRAAAESLLSQDPYAKAGLFAETELVAFKWTIGAPA